MYNSKTKQNHIKTKLIATIAVLIIVAIPLCMFIINTINIDLRKNRITEIFNSLQIDSQKYIITHESIFGEKRLYEWDSSRSYSSERTYMRGANVDATTEELKNAISNTDFEFYEEPYPDSADLMYIYKSPRGEYLRVSVASKPRQDAFYNNFHMGLSVGNIDIDPNTGPSNVSIKVNLDDNNE
jgi:hypothetical protein